MLFFAFHLFFIALTEQEVGAYSNKHWMLQNGQVYFMVSRWTSSLTCYQKFHVGFIILMTYQPEW